MKSSITRRRAAIACSACRARKIRCDGGEPICGRCHDLGQQCEYDHMADKRKPPSKRYVEALLSHIRNLENRLQQYQSASIPDGKSEDYSAITRTSAYRSETSGFGTTTTTTPLEVLAGNESDDLVADLTRLYGHLGVAEDGQLRYFGAPSYFNLPKRTQYEALDPDTPSEREDYGTINSGLSDELQHHLLDLFWTWQNPWQYFIYKRVFNQALARGVYTENCTPLLLQAVLALASRYSDRPEVRDSPDQCSTAGNALADQAKTILHFEMETPTVSTVAALLVLSLWEMAVNKEALGWTYAGMAVRTAYNLGLNHDCTEWLEQKKITEDDAEIRKITFWGCYMLDKLFNLALGRPGMIQRRDITVPKPNLLQDTEYAAWGCGYSNSQAVTSTSRSVSNMHLTCSIFEIACDVLDEIWAPNSKLSLAEKEEYAARAYTELEHAYNDLPSFMRLTSPRSPRAAHHYSFHLQYYTIVILLHRPFLRSQTGRHQLDKSALELNAHHHQVCTHAAEKVSSILKVYRSSYTLRAIPISTVHAVGTASIIQILNSKSRDHMASRKASRLLGFNIQCLQEMSRAWMWSLRALQCIQIMMEDWSIGKMIGMSPKATRAERTGSEASATEATASTLNSVLPAPPTSEAIPTNASSPQTYWDSQGIDWSNLAASCDLDWLMQIDSQNMESTVDTMTFNHYLRPKGLYDQM